MDGGLRHCIGHRDQDDPQEKEKRKKAKWVSEEALQIAVKRREAKSKVEKERYKLLNAEFQCGIVLLFIMKDYLGEERHFNHYVPVRIPQIGRLTMLA